MFDTIPQILPDSVPFYLQREPVAVVDSTQELLSKWWYEVIPTDSSGTGFIEDSLNMVGHEGVVGNLLPINDTVNSVFFLLFVVALGLMGVVLMSGEGWIFGSLKRALKPAKEPRKVFRSEVTATAGWAVVSLVLQSLLVATMILYKMVGLWARSLLVLHPALLFGLLFVSLLLFLLLKVAIYRVTAVVFPDWEFRRWIVRYYNLMGLLGVLLFVPALFFVFTPEWSFYALWAIVLVIVFLIVVVLINLLNIFVKNRIGLLNYFLYLCAFEIIPLVLIYKGVTMII